MATGTAEVKDPRNDSEWEQVTEAQGSGSSTIRDPRNEGGDWEPVVSGPQTTLNVTTKSPENEPVSPATISQTLPPPPAPSGSYSVPLGRMTPAEMARYNAEAVQPYKGQGKLAEEKPLETFKTDEDIRKQNALWSDMFKFLKDHGYDDDTAAALATKSAVAFQPAQKTMMSREQYKKYTGKEPPTDDPYFEVQVGRLGQVMSALPTIGPKGRAVFYSEGNGKFASVLLDPYTNELVGSVNHNVTPPSYLLPHISEREGVYEDANGNPKVISLTTIRGVASGGLSSTLPPPPAPPAPMSSTSTPSGPPVITEELIKKIQDANKKANFSREQVITILEGDGYVMQGQTPTTKTTPAPTTPTNGGTPSGQGKISGVPDLESRPSDVFRPGVVEKQQANARSIREAVSQLMGTPENPDFKGLDRYAHLGDDAAAKERIGTVFHLIMDKRFLNDSGLEAALPGGIHVPGLLSLLANYVGLPTAVARSEAAAAMAALGSMTPEEREYVDRVFATISSWPAARKLTSQGVYRSAIEALERDIPVFGVNTFDRGQFYDKAASMAQTPILGWAGISNQILTDTERNYITNKQKEYQREAAQYREQHSSQGGGAQGGNVIPPETKFVDGVTWEKVQGGWRKRKQK